ncbi:hypothetical protein TrCOL_g12457 [Triparma columacea]|uniref:Mur ligase central domain-containing protein n=1 Tax=Triparma columacea TaxID=722753 RepID=A0A9W7L1J6_9STRA|nr:hypothetical protein TrCOL_g12457 [Triparma columacea]
MPTKYESLVRRLYRTNLYNPVKLGLNNIELLLGQLGCPYINPTNLTTTTTTPPPPPLPPAKIIHIAGTNGKGSVAYKIASTLTLAGVKTGLFVSPHVSSFRERCQVDFECISENDVETHLPGIFDTCREHDIPATFFEITTALALQYFRSQSVQAIVLETGLGGRLDSTNVVDADLAVVTSIGLEHTRILGDTLELIAAEKAGIFKSGKTAVIGVDLPFKVMEDKAEEVGCRLVKTRERGREDGFKDMDFDRQNMEIARKAIDEALKIEGWDEIRSKVLPSHITTGLNRRPPCRYESLTYDTNGSSITVILDVAHNPPALEQLMKKLNTDHPGRTLRFVVGMSSDKDLGLCAETLLRKVGSGYIHLVEAEHPRAAKIEDILEQGGEGLEGCYYDMKDRGVGKQTKLALSLAAGEGEIVVVCGSVFLMANAREAVGIKEPRDSEFIAKEAGANLRKDMQEHFGNRVLSEDEEEEEESYRDKV